MLMGFIQGIWIMIDSNLSGLNLTQTRRPTRCGEASLIKKRSQLEKNI